MRSVWMKEKLRQQHCRRRICHQLNRRRRSRLLIRIEDKLWISSSFASAPIGDVTFTSLPNSNAFRASLLFANLKREQNESKKMAVSSPRWMYGPGSMNYKPDFKVNKHMGLAQQLEAFTQLRPTNIYVFIKPKSIIFNQTANMLIAMSVA